MKTESNELKEYVESSIRAITSGVIGSGYKIIKPILFDLAVINTAEGQGGLKIYVANASGKLKSEEISHIKFEAQPTAIVANQFRSINHSANSAK